MVGLCLAFAGAGCASATTRAVFDETERALAAPRTGAHETAANVAASESAVTGPLTREIVVRLAAARDPALSALAHRARALMFAARAESALPAPEIEGQVWNLPIVRPYSLGEASMYMVGVSQMIPALGGLDARARGMVEEARAVLAQAATREREVVRMADETYADLLGATLHHHVHHAQLQQLEHMREVARSRYSAGGSALADVTRIELEQARHRRDLVRYESDAARARATLNTVLHRAPDAPLGEPSDLDAETVRLGFDELVARAERARGDVRAAEARARAADARVRANEADANWPSFRFGVSYMQDPVRTPGFGALASMTLPWLSGAGRARVSQAREEAAAERAETDAARWSARREISIARAQMTAAEASLRVLRSDAMPAAIRSIEAIRASYVTGDADLLMWLDASRMAIDFQMEEADAIADLARAVAALDGAVGESLPRVPVATDGVAR